MDAGFMDEWVNGWKVKITIQHFPDNNNTFPSIVQLTYDHYWLCDPVHVLLLEQQSTSGHLSPPPPGISPPGLMSWEE